MRGLIVGRVSGLGLDSRERTLTNECSSFSFIEQK
jgi:hypothetical protein